MNTSSTPPSSTPSRRSSSSESGAKLISDLLNKVTVAERSPGQGLLDRNALSGELTRHSSGGNVLSISAKNVTAMSFTSSSVDSLCCGFIGREKQVFCLKSKRSCSISSHSNSKFLPKIDHFYICKNQAKDSAWCDFTASRDQLVKMDCDVVNDPSFEQPLAQWKALFENAKTIEEDSNSIDLNRAFDIMTRPLKQTDLRTPAKVSKFGLGSIKSESNLFRFPALQEHLEEEASSIPAKLESARVAIDDRIIWNDALPASLTSHVDNLASDIASIYDELTGLKQNLPSMLDDVSKDLTDLVSNLTGLQQSIGVDTESTHKDLWSAVSEIDFQLLNLDFGFLKNSSETSSAKIKDLEADSTTNQNHWLQLGTNWLPLISSNVQSIQDLKLQFEKFAQDHTVNTNVQTLSSMLSSGPLSSTQTSSANNHQGQQHHSTSFQQSSDSNKIIEDLQLRLNQVESKMSSLETSPSDSSPGSNHLSSPSPSVTHPDSFGVSGVTYKNYYFSGPNDVKDWLRKNVNNPSHGLFVDLVSFTEFFGDEHYVERKTTLNEFYLTNKIGYATLADGVVATSFKNVLPAAYGRASTGSTSGTSDIAAQSELPGLTSFSKWDNKDGRTGRRYWIRDETRKTEKQIDGWIRTQLSGPAQLLAKDLLVDSYAMSDALHTFITTSYEDIMHPQKFTSSQAWSLVSSFVKRIFTELGYVRVTARDSINAADPWTTAASFLFATLKAHVIMQEFMRLDITDHPSISSEMVKFVCYSQPATSASDLFSRVQAVESLQRSDQSNISKLEARTKRIETWKSDVDKSIKKLKETSAS